MRDEYKEFIVESGIAAAGLTNYRRCPFCGKHVPDKEIPADFEIHLSVRKDMKNGIR